MKNKIKLLFIFVIKAIKFIWWMICVAFLYVVIIAPFFTIRWIYRKAKRLG